MSTRFLTKTHVKNKLKDFNDWLDEQPAKYRLIVGGNHDKFLEILPDRNIAEIFTSCHFLRNEVIEVEGLRVFGTSLSHGKSGNCAFQSKEYEEETMRECMRMQGGPYLYYPEEQSSIQIQCRIPISIPIQ